MNELKNQDKIMLYGTKEIDKYWFQFKSPDGKTSEVAVTLYIAGFIDPEMEEIIKNNPKSLELMCDGPKSSIINEITPEFHSCYVKEPVLDQILEYNKTQNIVIDSCMKYFLERIEEYKNKNLKSETSK